MGAVYKREIKAYLHNVYGFLFAAVLLLVFGFVMFMFNFNPNYRLAELSYSFMYAELALLFLVPILCMRTMSEDRRNKTDLFFLSLPMRTSSVVLGKYFALLTVYAIPTLIISLYPLLLSGFGEVNMLGAYASIFMFFLLGAALMAVCMFVSSLTGHMVISAVLGILAMGVFYFLPRLADLLPYTALASYIALLVLTCLVAVAVYFFSKSLKVALIGGGAVAFALTGGYVLTELLVKNGIIQDSPFAELIQFLFCEISPFYLFEGAIYGQVFDIFSVVMMLSVAVFFVCLTIQQADRRRWA